MQQVPHVFEAQLTRPVPAGPRCMIHAIVIVLVDLYMIYVFVRVYIYMKSDVRMSPSLRA